MKKYVFLLFFIPFISISQPAKKIARIDSVLTYLHERQLFNGTVLIGEKGKVLFKKAYGISHPQKQALLTSSSAFNLGSISKQFYAMMVMMLKEKGKLGYDDPVQKYLPVFPYANITIRHLLNQTSGLPEYFDIAAGDMILLDTLTNVKLLELLASKKPALVFVPGDQWQYCNTNYTTLSSIIESITGITVEKYFQRNIADPLHLNDSYIYHLQMESYPSSRVFGLRYQENRYVLNDLVRYDGVTGDGNVYSSVDDLYKWTQALQTDKLVKKATYLEAITPAKLNDGSTTQYGFGWFIDAAASTLYHTGTWVGFANIIVQYTVKNHTLIVLDNSSNQFARSIVRNIWEDKPIIIPTTHLITNVKVIDGTGLSAYDASVRIVNDRIHDIGKLNPYPNENVTEGKGKILAPGFIDSHSHHDGGLVNDPSCVAATNQGITTIVVGQDGDSDPIDSMVKQLKKKPISVNMATYTGQAWLREQFMKDNIYRKASEGEIDSMKVVLAHEMDKGSLGLSTGLEYEAAFYSNRDEVVELAKVAAKKGGRYISHLRSEDLNLNEAVDEIIEIGRLAKIPVQVSHFKIAMRSNWGTAGVILNKLQQARVEGVNITADVYPYPMWNSTPRVLFPKKDFENLASAELATRELFDPASSVMVRYTPNRAWQGKTVTEIALINNETPAQSLLRIIRESAAPEQSATIVATSMSEWDINAFIKWPFSNICSDGTMRGHPRGHGAFTRVLGRYVREQNLMPIEIAIQKMTSLTAENVGIKSRGIIAKGYYADLVLFDPATVIDNATIANPTALSTGIESVWVNGKVVFSNQKAIPHFPGRFLKRGED